MFLIYIYVLWRTAIRIKPITPYNMTMQYAAKQYTFRWISGYENHTYAEILPFQYILSYHKEGYPDTVSYELEPGTEYIAKVCSEVIPSSSYDGTKSLWSYPVKWKLTAVKEDPVKICNKFFIAQCRTPYVGPSVEAWVPFKMQEPGSETGMPCADINLLPDERLGEKPVCLQTDDADMGFLSLADLEPSDETSSPPVALTPNLACFTQNYCTLTNTAIGLIPTLSAGNRSSDT
uniref:Uncharacterized protein n=1 Tax=Electrophorus electricus TaxID=8005 RepID=A0A4W4DQX0_ELEEL